MWPGEIVPVKDIREVVEAVAGLPTGSIMRPNRQRNISWHRQLVCLLALELNAMPLTDIGRALGIDHTTVIHGGKRARERVENDPYWRKMHSAARAALYGKRTAKRHGAGEEVVAAAGALTGAVEAAQG